MKGKNEIKLTGWGSDLLTKNVFGKLSKLVPQSLKKLINIIGYNHKVISNIMNINELYSIKRNVIPESDTKCCFALVIGSVITYDHIISKTYT